MTKKKSKPASKKPATKTIDDGSGALVIVRADEESVADTSERMNAEHTDEGDKNVNVLGKFTDRRIEFDTESQYDAPAAPVPPSPEGDLTPGRVEPPKEEEE